ncbi:MAG: BspA family leucine-rich repeat surface protein [Lachnospiraceae bacterium]|nr:BspA family leucine-rich repeat surface protein [Lachnospiraceae bacterium]
MKKSKRRLLTGLLCIALLGADIMSSGIQVFAANPAIELEAEYEESSEDSNENDIVDDDSTDKSDSNVIEAEEEDESEDEQEKENSQEQDTDEDNVDRINEDESKDSADEAESGSTDEDKIVENIGADGVASESVVEILARISSEDDLERGVVDEDYGHIAWVIDVNGKLKVEGTGDYCNPDPASSSLPPWYSPRYCILSAEINVKGMTNSSYMFTQCERLKSVDLRGLDTTNVTDMSRMFFKCESLTNLDLRNFNTRNVINMYNMFFGCDSLTSINVSSFNIENVVDMGGMFEGCESLTSLDISSFSIANATDINMGRMFEGCSSLTTLDLSSLDTANATDMGYMFEGCSSLTRLDVSGFDTVNVKNMTGMFSNCTNLASLNLSDFNTVNVTDMGYMFDGCSSLTNLDLSNFDTANVTDMGYMFHNCSSLVGLDISSFDTANVTTMRDMFSWCGNLIGLDVKNFETVNVESMFYMFAGCENLTHLDVSNFITTNVKNFDSMFAGCKKLTKLDLRTFDMLDIDAGGSFYMLDGCYGLNEIYTPIIGSDRRISLPKETDSDVWYMHDGTKIDYISDLSESVHIMKNEIPGKYGITFDPQGGKINYNEQTGLSTLILSTGAEDKIKKLPDGVKDDYLFVGWYTAVEGGTRVTEDYIFTENTTLFARYEEKPLTAEQSAIKPKSVTYKYAYEKIDVLKKAHSIESDHEPFTLVCTSVVQTKVRNYILYYNEEVIAESANGAFIDIDPSKYDTGGVFYLETVGADNGKTAERVKVKLLLQIKNKNIAVPSSISLFGSGFSVTLDEDVPIVGGQKISLAFPDIPFSCVVEDNKIKLGLNLKEKTLYSADSYNGETTSTPPKSLSQQVEEWKKDLRKSRDIKKDVKGYLEKDDLDADIPGMEKKCKLTVFGYLESEFYRSYATGAHEFKTVSGEIVVAISGSRTTQKQSAIPIGFLTIPVTFNCSYTGNGTLTGKLKWDFTSASFFPLDADVTGSVSVAVEPYGGVGVGKWVSVGLYGKAEIGTNFTVASTATTRGLDDVYLYGEAGIKAYFAKKEGKVSLISMATLEKKWPTYFDNKNHLLLWSRKQDSLMNKVDSSDVSRSAPGMELMDIQFAMSEVENSSVVRGFVDLGKYIDNAYAGAEPQIASSDAATILVYIDYDTSRAEANQTVVKYALIADDGTISTPVIMFDDGTADTNPVLYSTGNDIYCAYLNSDKVYDDNDDPDIDAYVGTFGVSVSKYDSEKGAFIDLGRVNKNHCYCYAPQLTETEEGIKLVWAENMDNDIFGLTGHNTIYSSVYSGGEWSVPDNVAENVNSITSLAVSPTGFVAWAVDEDNDLTTDIQSIYVDNVLQAHDSASYLTWTNLPGVMGTVLACNINGGLAYIDGSSFVEYFEEGIMDSSSPFVVYNGSIYFLKTSGGQRNVLAAFSDNNNETGIGQLTITDDYVDAFSLSNGKLAALITKVSANEEDGNMSTSSSIYIYDDERYDLVLDEANYDLDFAMPGKRMPINLAVSNAGTKTISSFNVTLESGESQEVDCILAPGESKTLTVYMTAPDSFAKDVIIKVSETDGVDSDESNNEQILKLSRTELSVVTKFLIENDARYLEATVTNDSYIDASMTLTAYDCDDNEINSVSEDVEAKSAKIYTIDISSYIPEDDTDSFVYVTVRTDQEEYYESNNTDSAGIWNMDPGEITVTGSDTENSSDVGGYTDGVLWILDGDGNAVIGIRSEEDNTNTELTESVWTDTSAERVTNIIVEELVTSIGENAFSNCNNLENITVLNDECRLAAGAIPSGTTVYGNYGSTAYEYAVDNGLKFEALDELTHDHRWDDGSITVEPTYEADGIEVYTCVYCGITCEKTLPMLGSANETVYYLVTFDSCNGDIGIISKNIVYEGICGELPVPTKKGYEFGGWYTEEGGNGELFTKDTVVTDNITVYAYWYYQGMAVEGVESDYIYTGAQIKPVATVYDGANLLANKKDYTVTYKNNTKVYTLTEADEGFDAAKAPTVIVTGKGNYKDKEKVYFTISPKNITDEDITVSDIAPSLPTNKNQTPVPKVTWGKKKLTNKTDYTVTYYSDEMCTQTVIPRDPGTYYVKVSGKGNYTGERVLTFVIAESTQKLVSKLSVGKIKDKPYTGLPIELASTELVVMDGKNVLTAGKDYIVTYQDNHTDIGTVTLTITGVGEIYVGTKTVTFKITGATLGKASMTGFKASLSYAYGSTVNQSVSFTYDGVMLSGISASEYAELTDVDTKRSYDYTYEYTNNINPGRATVVYTGINRFTGTIRKTYTITGTALSKAKIETAISSFTYDGTAKTQDILKLTYTASGTVEPVELNGILKSDYDKLGTTEQLKYDYIIDYQNNVRAGTAKIILTGVNGYTGTVTKTYKIAPFDISKDASNTFKIALDSSAVYYSKAGAKPEPVVTFNGEVLKKGTDYTVSWSNNKAVNDGTGTKKPTITVKGKGNFKGTDGTTTFTISQRLIDDGSIKVSVSDKVYSTKKNAWKSSVVVIDADGKKLSMGTDYEKAVVYTYKDSGALVADSDVVPAGTTIVATVTGKGNYIGALSGEYRVVTKDIGKVTATVYPKTYTGKEVKLSESDIIFKSGKDLLTGVTYTIDESTYKNNINKGKATVVINGTGDYGGAKKITYTIGAKGFLWWWRNLSN